MCWLYILWWISCLVADSRHGAFLGWQHSCTTTFLGQRTRWVRETLWQWQTDLTIYEGYSTTDSDVSRLHYAFHTEKSVLLWSIWKPDGSKCDFTRDRLTCPFFAKNYIRLCIAIQLHVWSRSPAPFPRCVHARCSKDIAMHVSGASVYARIRFLKRLGGALQTNE